MADRAYTPPPGFMTLGQAQTVLGVSKATMAKRVRDGLLETYQDARDTRVRLVRTEDVKRLQAPVKTAA